MRRSAARATIGKGASSIGPEASRVAGDTTGFLTRAITYQIELNEVDRRGYKVRNHHEFRGFLKQLENTSADSNPGWRYEYLKPNEKRKMKANKLQGRRSVNRVKALLDLIDIKRDIRMD